MTVIYLNGIVYINSNVSFNKKKNILTILNKKNCDGIT